MQSVDFKRYADIIVNLQMKNDNYWLLKHFDDQLLEQLRFRFDKNSGAQMMEKLKRLQQEALTLKETSEPPDSEKAQKYAKDFWDMIMEFTQGDMSMLPKLMELGTSGATNEEWKKRQTIVNEYSEAALEIYLESLGVNPFNIE